MKKMDKERKRAFEKSLKDLRKIKSLLYNGVIGFYDNEYNEVMRILELWESRCKTFARGN
jgi:hypothetical protein